MKKLRIAQISNLVEPITDSSTNGLAQIVYHLTQELAGVGHDVTLYAPQPLVDPRQTCPTSQHPSAVVPLWARFCQWPPPSHILILSTIILDSFRPCLLISFPSRSSRPSTIPSSSTSSTGIIPPKSMRLSFGRSWEGLSKASPPSSSANSNETALAAKRA